MDRMSIDLEVAHVDFPIIMKRWKYLFIGDCTGTVTIKLGSVSGSPLNPNEFDKLTGIENYKYMFIDNTTQIGKELNIYFEEEKMPEDMEIRN